MFLISFRFVCHTRTIILGVKFVPIPIWFLLNQPHIGQKDHIDVSCGHMTCQNLNNSSRKWTCKERGRKNQILRGHAIAHRVFVIVLTNYLINLTIPNNGVDPIDDSGIQRSFHFKNTHRISIFYCQYNFGNPQASPLIMLLILIIDVVHLSIRLLRLRSLVFFL